MLRTSAKDGEGSGPGEVEKEGMKWHERIIFARHPLGTPVEGGGSLESIEKLSKGMVYNIAHLADGRNFGDSLHPIFSER